MKNIKGVIFVGSFCFIAKQLHLLISPQLSQFIGLPLFVLLIGFILNNFFDNQWLDPLRPGIKFCSSTLLKFAIILLGFKITLGTISSMGIKALLLIIISISMALALTHLLGKLMNVTPKLSALIGLGAAICGNTAISACAPLIKANEEEISYAIATNTLFGSIAVISYPIIAKLFHFSDVSFGYWAGVAINDTSQVIAASFNFSESAGNIATTLKLMRNSFIGLAIIIASIPFNSLSPHSNLPIYKRIKFPLFICIFFSVIILNSLGLMAFIPNSFLNSLLKATKFIILMALFAFGTNTNFKSIKSLGITPLVLGFMTSVTTSTLTLTFIYFFLT